MDDITKQYEAKYPEKEFKKSTFSFTAGELRNLQSMDTISKMGQLAQVMLQNFIQQNCLKRVQVKNSPDVGLLYDTMKGEFYTWEPRFWCSTCTIRKAGFQYKDKIYCQSCLDTLRKQQVEKEVKPIKEEKMKPKG